MAVTDEARQALDRQMTVEITTIGRRSGRPRTGDVAVTRKVTATAPGVVSSARPRWR